MHRLMLTSQAYRQTSRVDEALIAADPENALLSRMPLQRMDAETLYDSLMSVAGRLDSTLFGPPSEVDVRPDKEVVVKPTTAGFRRSIYVLHRRQTPVSLLDAFDQPAMTPNCTERRRSNVATQALHMMNGSMTWDLARYMAGRVIDEAGADTSKQIESIYLRAFSRRPAPTEVVEGQRAIAEFRKAWPARLAKDNGEAPREAGAELAGARQLLPRSVEFGGVQLYRLRSGLMANRTRRDFFSSMVDGLHGTALATLLGADLFSAAHAGASEPASHIYDLKPKAPQFPARAKSVIHLFMNGGPSQMDLFDPKPTLKRLAGTAPSRELSFAISNGKVAGTLFPSPFEFKRQGSAAWKSPTCCRTCRGAPTTSR